ncbi:ceroid-lipofuscinosis neuronal protein 6-like [Elysia marginata]|uniref:Ceroid-lipofuscinosis neuronal protein 6-like n=1 Tax=Elysia marginata TaxID=1093978 RepID=A0AAV4IL36_9GAST|nr:ceroid-lipofuscinosis neuronal protein 6-like [Elysia marginata]
MWRFLQLDTRMPPNGPSGARHRRQKERHQVNHDVTGNGNSATDTGLFRTTEAGNLTTGYPSPFHFDLWLLLALDNWIFDFGRPIAAIWVPLTWTPLDMPSVGDYFHMAYNILTPFCLINLMERSRQRVSPTFTLLSVLVFELGASMHLVGDSVNHRLIHLGFQNHLKVKDNPIMKELKPKELVKSFELLYRYDEEIGHLMWYIPFFLCLFLYFLGCFGRSKFEHGLGSKVTIPWILLVIASGTYYWYLATEGQIFPLFLSTFGVMLGTYCYKFWQGYYCDDNGRFLLWTFALAIFLTLLWSVWLYDDVILRHKYPGFLYVPEPWAYYTLYLAPK